MRNFTSESHDGYRAFDSPVILVGTEPLWPPGDVKAGRKRLGITFLMSVSIIGSPAENPSVDDCTAGGVPRVDCIALETDGITELTTAAVAAVLFTAPCSRLPPAVCCWPLVDHRPSASQKSALQIARIDHGNHPSQTKATRPNRSHVIRVPKD